MNWLDPPGEPPEVEAPRDPQAPSESNLNYWAARLTPLHDPTPGYSSPPALEDPQGGKEVVFVACNRVGEEEGACGERRAHPVSRDPVRSANTA
jgi:protein N-terminal amidase